MGIRGRLLKIRGVDEKDQGTNIQKPEGGQGEAER